MGIIKDILYKLSNKKFVSIFNKQTIFPYYHIVRNDKVVHIEHLYSYKNETQFRSDIDFLLQNYLPLEPSRIFETNIPENSFLLTFDDGLEEIYSVIFPILKEKGIKAIFFINPDFVDNKDILYKHEISIIINHIYKINFDLKVLKEICLLLSINFISNIQLITELKNLKYADKFKLKNILIFLRIDIAKYLFDNRPYVSKEQIKEMMRDGYYFGGHTMSHPPLNQLTFENQKNEIINSINWLKSNFEINYSLFAFPFTDKNSSKKLLLELFKYDNNMVVFGNAGLKKDMDRRIIQRFSLENPKKSIGKQIVTENFYKIVNIIIGKYQIIRK